MYNEEEFLQMSKGESEEEALLGEHKDLFSISKQELEEIESDVPLNPSKEEIKKILSELPAQIEYLKTKGIACKTQIENLKLLIKHKKQILERDKSRIRQEKLEAYKAEQEQYYEQMKEVFKDVVDSDSKLAKSTLQEMLKVMRPEKPSRSELDDFAIMETDALQEEIIRLERKLNRYEEILDLLKVRSEKFENKLKVAISHKGILVAEMQFPV